MAKADVGAATGHVNAGGQVGVCVEITVAGIVLANKTRGSADVSSLRGG